MKTLLIFLAVLLGFPALAQPIIPSTPWSIGWMTNKTAASARAYLGVGTGSGTVTSVGLSAPSFLTVSGSPVTTSGTLALTLSGTALPVTSGGSGATTLTGILFGNGASAFTAGNLSGDIATSGSLVTTLKNTGTAGTYTSVTTDAQGRVTAGSNPSGSVTLDQVLAAAASSAVNHAGNTNQWRWTDAGLLKASFTLKASQTTATSIGFNISEFAAATGGAGSQDLFKINTLAGSTANPFHVLNQTTNSLLIYGPTGQLLVGSAAGNSDNSYPMIAYLLDQRYGINFNPSGYQSIINNQVEDLRIDTQGGKTVNGSVSNPSWSFINATSSGMRAIDASTVALVGGGKDAVSSGGGVLTLFGRVLLSATNNILYNVNVPAWVTGTTNILVDFSMSDLSLETTTNMCLYQSTNRSTSTTNAWSTSIRIFANGGNVIVNTNSALAPGWRMFGAQTLPITITNGDWGHFTFISYGPNETNVAFSYNYAH